MKDLPPLMSRLVRDESAVVSIMLAGTMLVTLAMTGLAVDFGRAEFVKIELQAALDAGGLAGGNVFNTSATTMQNEAMQYFGANWRDPFQSSLPAGSPTYTATLDPSTNTLTKLIGTASVNVPATMLWAIGQSTMAASASNVVDTPSQSGGIELAMVLDNTGSEATGCKLMYVVAAAQGMVNQLYGVQNPSTTNVLQPHSGCPTDSNAFSRPVYSFGGTLPPNPPKFFWTTVVPFVAMVNPVPSADMTTTVGVNTWKNAAGTATLVDSNHKSDYPLTDPWQGCVEARLYSVPGDLTDPYDSFTNASKLPDPYGGEDAVPTQTSLNGVTIYGAELNPSQVPFTRYFWPSDTDIAANSANPADANFPNGEPNAPYWPAFNVWNNGTIFGDGQTILATNRSIAVDALCDGFVGPKIPICITSNATNNLKTSAAVTDEYKQGPTAPAGTVSAGQKWADNTPSGYHYVYGPNFGCPQPMTVMSTDYKTIMSNIGSMFPIRTGGTATDIGLAWGWRALSPNWQGVWAEGANSGVSGQLLPLPYNSVLTDPSTGGKIAMKKVVIFMTDGNNSWFTGDGTNAYTAFKTLDHTPLLDQSPPWTNTTNVPAKNFPPNQAPKIPVAVSSLSALAGRVASAETAMTNRAWALCDAMQADGILMYTILLEFNQSDISAATAAGYQTHCSTDPVAGTHFWQITGNEVSELSAVFTSIGNSLSELRLAQ
jgi:Putative Flp pilus-assembly TadE/G-like